MGKKEKRRCYMFYLHGKFKDPYLEEWLCDHAELYTEDHGKETFVLYGFTENKDTAITFMGQRNMKRFALVPRDLECLSREEIDEYQEFKKSYSAAELIVDSMATRYERKLRDGTYLTTYQPINMAINKFENDYVTDFSDSFSDYASEFLLDDVTDAIIDSLSDKMVSHLRQIGLFEVINFLEDFSGVVCLDEVFILLDTFGELFNRKGLML